MTGERMENDHEARARRVWEEVCRLLYDEGYRREERGSGWWWAPASEVGTVGGALETVLHDYGIDTRESFDWETEVGWS